MFGKFVSAQAKNYSFFRMEISPYGSYILNNFNSGWGGGLSLEPKLNFTDNISAGIKLSESFFYSKYDYKSNNDQTSLLYGFAVMNSYGIVGEYYFTKNKVRPFVGLAFKRYRYTYISDRITINDSIGTLSVKGATAKKWGLEPEIGISFPGVRLSISYNYLFGGRDIIINEMRLSNSNQFIYVNGGDRIINYNHLNFKLGFTIAGRKKR